MTIEGFDYKEFAKQKEAPEENTKRSSLSVFSAV